jgi:lysyl-tRNA synthetase class 2
MAPTREQTLRGRITWVGGGRLRLENVDGPLRVTWNDATESLIGCWAEIDATETSTGWIALRVRAGEPPLATFPKAAGDWLALQRDERLAIRRLAARAKALRALRALLDEEGFLEVETPLAVPSPGLDLHLAAFDVGGMRAPRWLITSPEYQMKRLLAGGLSRVYQLARCFRKDERGRRHEPEFTMLEWYRAFEGADALMRDTERIVSQLALTLRDTTVLPIDALGARSPQLDLAPPWDRITVEEALARHTTRSLPELLVDEQAFFLVWSHEVEPKLGFERPVFVIDWPASMASLARLHPDRPAFADRFEAYVCGVEICNGFGELIDPVEQRARLVRDQEARRAAGLPVYPIDERFLGALEEGLPPCAGNAMGFDRVLALLLGAHDVADVMAFGSDRT